MSVGVLKKLTQFLGTDVAGPAVDYLSPIPSGHSRFEVGGGLRLESHLHDASSHASHSSASRCSPPEAIQVTLKSAGLPRILTHKKPPMSEESGVSGWRRHQGKVGVFLMCGVGRSFVVVLSSPFRDFAVNIFTCCIVLCW